MKIRDKVLIVEDEQNIKNFMSTILAANGFDTLMAGSAKEALSMISSHCPDLIILDLGLPDMDGMEVLKQVRAWSSVPVIVVSARTHEGDKVAALDLGADDYIEKPFGTSELLARIRTAIRHTRTGLDNDSIAQSGKYTVRDLTIDYDKHHVLMRGEDVHLTLNEFKIVALLGKYARGITIDMDAMEEQIREAESIDPDSMASAVNITKVAFPDTPEQKQAMKALENLLALVEGWVDAVVWRAGMAHIPHIEQLREMLRRERAIGGPAERTFESLMGMQLRPKRMREAAALWESIGAQEGPEARDAKWSHPDLLPQLPDEQSEDSSNEENGAASATTGTEQTTAQQDIPDSIDWDAELSKLLDEEEHKGDDADSTNDADGTDDAGDTNASGDPQSPEEA